MADLSRDIGRLEGKIDGLVKLHEDQFRNLSDSNKEQFRILNEHQNSINSLELWKAGITGKVTMVGVFFGVMGGIFMAFVKEIWGWITNKTI